MSKLTLLLFVNSRPFFNMNLGSDLISLSATVSLFYSSKFQCLLCEFYSATLRAQFRLGSSTKSGVATSAKET